MDYATPPQPQEEKKHTSLKVFEIVIFIAVVIGALYYYIFYIRNAPKVSQEQIQKQRQEAIAKRDVSLCPSVENLFNNSVGADAVCVSAIKNLTTLDTLNTLIVRAIKEKNEKLCSTAEKSFSDVCVKAVRDSISGKVKPPVNPMMGY